METNNQATMMTALLNVQGELPKLQKTAINPHFKNKFIPLEELVSAVMPILNKHGFVLLQQPTTLDGEPALRYRLMHKDGGMIEDVMLLQSKGASPQDQGSAITYARRYSLMAFLGLVADQDDDGQKATEATKAPISATNEQAIYSMLNKLEMNKGTLEEKLGKSIESLTNVEATKVISQLKTQVQRQAVS